MLLLGAAFIACGLAASAVTDSQGVSALLTYGVLVLSWFLAWNEAALSERVAPVVVGAVALRPLLRLRAGRHRQPRRGLLRCAFIALFLFLALRALGARSWRGVVVTRSLALLAAQVLAVASILASLLVLAGRHPVRFDLTPERSLTLSPHTRQVLARLRRSRSPRPRSPPAQEQGIRREIEDLLALYRDAQPLFRVRMLDLDRSPGEAERLGVSNYNVVVLESGGRRERVDLVNEESAHGGAAGGRRTARHRRVRACRATASPTPATPTSAAAAAHAAAALAGDGFDVRPLPGAARIPADAGLVVLAGADTRSATRRGRRARGLRPRRRATAGARGSGRPALGGDAARPLRDRARATTSWWTSRRRSSAPTACRRGWPR